MELDFLWPSSPLLKLWREWIELHTVLDKGMPGTLAAPFFSAASSQTCPNRIMVVGKATKGNCGLDEYMKVRSSPDDAVRNRLSWNRKLIREHGNRSPFWVLFRQLADLYPEPDSCSFVWSDIAKIGNRNGNPKGILLTAQKDLAERTLRQEVEEYDPALVVFTNSNYSGEVINRALDLTHKDWKHSRKSDPDNELWWREGPPAMLGTRHPQGVRTEMIHFWLRKARKLVRAS